MIKIKKLDYEELVNSQNLLNQLQVYLLEDYKKTLIKYIEIKNEIDNNESTLTKLSILLDLDQLLNIYEKYLSIFGIDRNKVIEYLIGDYHDCSL